MNSINQIRIVQYLSVGLGTLLLTKMVLDNSNPSDKSFMDNKSKTTILLSGVLVLFPFTLEREKKNRMINALKEAN